MLESWKVRNKMSKRFTATEKWNDGWFLGLHKDHKLIWGYILDTCTNGGRWVKNFKMLNFCCDCNIADKDFKDIFDGRVIEFKEFYFIPKFLRFQYPKGLNSEKPAIVSVRNEVLQYKLLETIRQSLGNNYLIIKDTDTDTDTDKDTEKGIVKGVIKRHDPEVAQLIHETAQKIKNVK